MRDHFGQMTPSEVLQWMTAAECSRELQIGAPQRISCLATASLVLESRVTS